jgi:hypothetical protein
VVKCLAEVVEGIHKEGALAGTHCCGNTEWTILADAGVDIISFDAYQYGETIGYYPRQIKTFLERGGVLAWGIVPSTGAITEETAEALVTKLEQHIGALAGKGLNSDILWERCLLTPSCGTGSMAQASAERVFSTLAEASRILRSKV